MPIEINGQIYYRTSEICVKAGVSRATVFRWLKAGILSRCLRDRRGWRLYTEDDLLRISSEANKIATEESPV